MAVQIFQQRRDMISLGSGFYFGPKSSGKTSALQREIEHVLENTEGTVFVISRSEDFQELTEKYEGIVIDLAKEPFNPLFIQDAGDMSEQDVVFLSKIKFGLAKLLIGSKLPKLTSLQKYLIEQVMLKLCIDCGDLNWSQYANAFQEMIETYQNKKIDKKLAAIKTDLHDIALELNITPIQSDSILLKDTFLKELEELSKAVSELGKLAAGKDQFNIGSYRLVIYDLTNVAKEETDLYRLMAVEDFWTRLNGNAPITGARLLIDDGDSLFLHYDKYLLMMYKMAKVHGFVITSVIEDTLTFLSKKSNFRKVSGYYELYSHSAGKVAVLKQQFNLSAEEMDWITNKTAGQKLVICEGNRFLVKAR